MSACFEDLTPDRILDAIEDGMECQLTGLTSPLPSYINRVYEVQDEDGEFHGHLAFRISSIIVCR